MDIRHKKKAISGVALWFAAIPLFLALGWLVSLVMGPKTPLDPPGNSGAFVGLAFFVFQYAVFFWGGSHLAKAKGYSNALVIFGLFWPAQPVIFAVLFFGLPDKYSRPGGSSGKSNRDRNESPIARAVRYRRNALIANLLGLMGILLALALIFLPIHLFPTRDDDRVAAIWIFIPAYAAVINGCWWWVKAKSWHEAVIFIGLMPLAVLVIPYVRLIYRFVPLLLPAMMVLMPILLIGVVASLPDKSGLPKRRR